VRFLHEDVFQHDSSPPYDAVIANFFLNVFSPGELERSLRKLASLTRHGGLLLVGDFAPASKNPLIFPLQWLYYMLPLVFFWLVTRNAFHGLYDYRSLAAHCDLRLESYETERIFGIGPRWLCRLSFRKRVPG
jgi:hypothetical protein